MGVLVAALALTPAAAWACDQPEEPEERPSVTGRAGEDVTLDIPNTLEGAEWVIRFDREDGDVLARGEDEDEDEGTEAEFEVPDLGADERRVGLLVSVVHEADEADWSYELDLEYRGRPAADPPREAEPEPEPPRPAPRPDPPDRSASAEPAPAPAAASPPPPPPPPKPAAPAAPAPALAMPAPVIPAPTPAPPAGGAHVPGFTALLDGISATGEAIPAVVASEPRAAKRPPRRHARRRSDRPEPTFFAAPARPRRHEPAEEGGVRLPEVSVPGFGAGLAWSLILGGGAAFALAGLGLGAMARMRRRRRLALR